MKNDLISRSALLEEFNGIYDRHFKNSAYQFIHDFFRAARRRINNAPTVDAVVLPEGKPGDYLEWDNGVGHRQIYAILSVMICKDCIRYELADFAPVVKHEGIVRILSPEEVEKMVKERGKAWKYMWCEDDNKAASGTEG